MTRIADRIARNSSPIETVPFTGRFGDEIAKSSELQTFYSDHARDLAEFIRKGFSEVPLVLADNVAEYCFAEGSGGNELPSVCVPPFPAVWVETSKPERITFIDGPWGALFIRRECQEMPDPIKWSVEMVLILENEGSLQTVPWSLYFYFNKDGEPLTRRDGHLDPIIEATIPPKLVQLAEEDPEYEQLKQNMLGLAWPFFASFAFMHFKNVVVEREELSRQAQRQAERRENKGEPFLKFNVLNIEPMKRVLRSEGRQDSVGIKRAFGLVRGNYATYDEDNPLFGKYTGKFWREAHWRGSRDIGEVVKKYNANPPSITTAGQDEVD
jgi:hypothetical protein